MRINEITLKEIDEKENFYRHNFDIVVNSEKIKKGFRKLTNLL